MIRSLCTVAILLLSLLTPEAARAQSLPQRWILAGDSIQTDVFTNVEFNIPGGDARDLTQAIIQQETGVVINNFSGPGATMSTLSFFPGLVQLNPAIAFVTGAIAPARGIIITLGVNDALRSDRPEDLEADVARFQQDYQSFVASALQGNLQVVCSLPLNEPGETQMLDSRRFRFQLAALFACVLAGVPQANIFNPAAVGIAPDLNDPAKRRLFASFIQNGVLKQDPVHLSREGHRLFATKLIDFMVQRGFWSRRP
jgi:lysophospholipase L1-like esterase